MTFLHWRDYKKSWILLKTTFEIPLFLIKELHDSCFGLYKYSYFPLDQQRRPSEKGYILWSHLLQVFLFYFSTYCFQNMC